MSFKIAASMGFKKALESAHPVLLEPMMRVEVSVPDEVVGPVIGDMNARRGRIAGVSAKGNSETITAQVPLAEMLKYSFSLNATRGGAEATRWNSRIMKKSRGIRPHELSKSRNRSSKQWRTSPDAS